MRLPKEDRAGLYITVIVHLTVIIVLLASGVARTIQSEHSFVLDFTKQEEKEKIDKEIEFKSAISRKIQALLGEDSGTPVKSIAVDRSALKDDRGTNAKELYKDAERIQRDMKRNQAAKVDEVNVSDPVSKTEEKKVETKVKEYTGPSVLTYELEGRKLSSKGSVPAYKCMGAGEVTVIIGVNPHGYVEEARVQDDVSSSDRCLRKYAIMAAKASRFTSKNDAPVRQQGAITYLFIAQ